MKLLNASAPGTVFYALHMVEGIAEYREHKDTQGNPLRIFVSESAIKNMDPSFAGRPVFVEHVDEVDPATVRSQADGWVVESFYNKADGKHWAKFVVITDQARERIRQGWKVSNAYHKKQLTGGGRWHGVDYSEELLTGEYEHLAIVPNPRYQESLVLTPEEFKAYNAKREQELFKLANAIEDKSKGLKKENKPMFSFFKKQKVENSADFEGVSVTLPKSGKEITIEQMVRNADEAELENSKPYMCNGDERVKVGEEEMSVNELIEKHLASLKPVEEKPANTEVKPVEEKPANTEEVKPVEEKPANEETEEQKSEKAKNMNALKNAEAAALSVKNSRIELSEDKVARGKNRYGSKK